MSEENTRRFRWTEPLVDGRKSASLVSRLYMFQPEPEGLVDMTNDRAVGGGVFGGGIAGIVIHGALPWYAPEATLQVTAFPSGFSPTAVDRPDFGGN